MKMAITFFFHDMPQVPPNPGFMQVKSTKRGFSKEGLARIDFFLF